MVVIKLSALKHARAEVGLSIEEAARKLKIPAGYLSEIENGKRQVSSDRADEIALVYQKQKDEIFLASRYAIREVSTGHTA